MRNLIWSGCFLILLSVVCFSQADDAALARAQKTLRNRLIADSPAIRSVKFDRCHVSIRSGGGSLWAPSQGSGNASRTGYFSETPSLSSGPDKLVLAYPSEHFTLDFSLLDIAKVVIAPTSRTDRPRFIVADEPTGVVTATMASETWQKFSGNKYVLVVSSKKQAKMIDAFGQMAAACAK